MKLTSLFAAAAAIAAALAAPIAAAPPNPDLPTVIVVPNNPKPGNPLSEDLLIITSPGIDPTKIPFPTQAERAPSAGFDQAINDALKKAGISRRAVPADNPSSGDKPTVIAVPVDPPPGNPLAGGAVIISPLDIELPDSVPISSLPQDVIDAIISSAEQTGGNLAEVLGLDLDQPLSLTPEQERFADFWAEQRKYWARFKKQTENMWEYRGFGEQSEIPTLEARGETLPSMVIDGQTVQYKYIYPGDVLELKGKNYRFDADGSVYEVPAEPLAATTTTATFNATTPLYTNTTSPFNTTTLSNTTALNLTADWKARPALIPVPIPHGVNTQDQPAVIPIGAHHRPAPNSIGAHHRFAVPLNQN
jgi:hypothetical protein